MALHGVHHPPGSSWRGARETPTTTGYHQLQTLPSYHLSDLVLGLASPGAFPCPENSPSFSVRFSKRAGDGHLVAFGTEFGQLIIVDTRAEARVQRDHNGPVGWGQTDRTRGITSGCGAKTRQRPGGVEGSGNVGLCRSWGVRQPEVVAQYRAFINCIFDLEWAHDDTRIVLAGGDAKIRVHDTETHAEVTVMCGHEGSVKTISVNPLESSVLLSGSRDGSFALWDTRLQQDTPLRRMTAVEYSGLAMAPPNRMQTRYISPVEQVYRANDGASNGRKRPRSFLRRDENEVEPAKGPHVGPVFTGLPCQSSVTAIHWMPGGQKFISAGQDGLVKLWDTRYATRPLQVAGNPAGAATGPSRRRSSRASSITTTTPRSNACGSPPPSPSPATVHPFPTGRAVPRSSPGGRGGGRSWSGAAAAAALGRISGGVTVAEEISDRGGRPCGVSSVHVCDDGSRIAVCTVKNHISVYSYAAGSLRSLGSFTGTKNVSSYYVKAKLSPDGSLLASGATNDAVCLWQVDRPGPPIARLMGHLNEVTGVDWCRAEPLKLATCSDDETVRIWTIDPLRVSRQSASRQPPPSSSSSSSSSSLAPTAGSHISAGNRDWDAISRGEGSGPAALRGVPSGGSYVVPGSAARGVEGLSGGYNSSGSGGHLSMGKFGFGTARAGESFWRRRASIANAPVDLSPRGGSSGCARRLRRRRKAAGSGGGGGGGQGSREAGGSQGQSVAEITTELRPPQMPTAEVVASAVSPARTGGASGVDGGQVVLSPRSRNKRAAEEARTPVPYSRAEAVAAGASGGGGGGTPGSSRGFRVGRPIIISSSSSSCSSAPAQGATRPTHANENMDPEGSQPTGGLVAAAAGIPAPQEELAAKDAETGGGDRNLDGAMGVPDAVLVGDKSAVAGSKMGRGSPLDALPRGWSSATRTGKGVRGPEAGPQQERKRQQEHEQQERRQKQREQTHQQQQKQGKHRGLQRRASGAASGGGSSSPLPLENRTLLAFWKWNQAASSRGVPGKAAAEKGGTTGMHLQPSS